MSLGTRAGPGSAAALPDLFRVTLRSIPWAQVIAGGVLAVGLVLATTGSDDLPPSTVVDRLRMASVLLAVGVAAVLDDPTRPHLDGAPVPLVVRQLLRTVVAIVATGAFWVLTLLAAAHHPSLLDGTRAGELPVVSLSVVLAGLVLTTLAVAAATTRGRGGAGAIPAAVTAVSVPAFAVVLPRLLARWGELDVTMYPPYLGPGPGEFDEQVWLAAHQRWLVIAVAATIVLAWVLPGPRWPGRIRDRASPARAEPEDPATTSVGGSEQGTPRDQGTPP